MDTNTDGKNVDDGCEDSVLETKRDEGIGQRGDG